MPKKEVKEIKTIKAPAKNTQTNIKATETKSTPATFRENVVKKIPLVMNFKNSD